MDEMYKRFFDAIPGYVTVQDRDLRMIASNSLFKKHFGDQPAAFCYEAYKHRNEPCPGCPVEKSFRDGRSHSSEQLITMGDGSHMQAIVFTTPLVEAW